MERIKEQEGTIGFGESRLRLVDLECRDCDGLESRLQWAGD